jgi:hypothetical protein
MDAGTLRGVTAMTKPKEKISDQLAGGRFVFLEPKSRSEVPTFGDMFPAVADLDIVIEENGDPTERFSPRYMTLANTTEPVDCSDPKCKGGGFLFMANGLRNAIADRKAEFHEALRCRGLTRQRPRPIQCTHRFTVAGKIRYREQAEDASK